MRFACLIITYQEIIATDNISGRKFHMGVDAHILDLIDEWNTRTIKNGTYN